MLHSEWIMAPPAFLQLRTKGYSCAPIREFGMDIFRNAAFRMRNGICFSIPPNAGRISTFGSVDPLRWRVVRSPLKNA